MQLSRLAAMSLARCPGRKANGLWLRLLLRRSTQSKRGELRLMCGSFGRVGVFSATAMPDRISNATDYEIMAGRLCPHCSATTMIERIRAGWLCNVCGKMWAALPEKYRGSWQA